MTELQQAEYDILEFFHSFAIANDIKYFLYGGTLLGSVRHRGFIPWDDDIDVGLRREIFDSFEEKFVNSDYKDKGYLYQSRLVYPYQALEISRIRNPNIPVREDVPDTQEGNLGPWIDVFPFDNVPDDPVLKEAQYKKIQFYNRLIKLFLLVKVGDNDRGIRRKIKALVQLINERFYRYYFFMPYIFRKRYSWMTRYNREETIRSGDLGYIYYKDFEDYKSTHFLNEDIEDIELRRFERGDFFAPIQAHRILRQCYGDDYMELPPLEERKTHSIKDI